MNEYKRRKEERAGALRHLTDNQVTTRLVVMEKIETGGILVPDLPDFVMNNLFPNGYNPESHPEDNATYLRAEATRRGLRSQ